MLSMPEFERPVTGLPDPEELQALKCDVGGPKAAQNPEELAELQRQIDADAAEAVD